MLAAVTGYLRPVRLCAPIFRQVHAPHAERIANAQVAIAGVLGPSAESDIRATTIKFVPIGVIHDLPRLGAQQEAVQQNAPIRMLRGLCVPILC